MSFTRIIVLAAMTGAFTVGGVHAQTTSNTVLPAEFPPESFTGKQYVDSNGCIFIRAGVSGNVTWVPRVGRDRKQICGYQPSTDSASAAAVPQPRTAATPPIEIAPDSTPTAATTTSAAPATVATTAPAAPKPQTGVATAATAPTAAPKVSTAKTAQATITQQPVADTRSYILAIDGRTGETVLVPPKTRVVPQHVYEIRQDSENVRVPRGYRAGWKDDRLNLRRAEGTLEGRAKMNLVWTNTVPRRLVSASTGQDATPPLPVVYILDPHARSKVAAVSTQSNGSKPTSRAAATTMTQETDNLR